jgi:hydroxymethylbilane synthase
MKDVPTEVPAGLVFPAICQREDVRDCLVSRKGVSLDQLPSGARLGTSSVRRRSQLLHHRPDLEIRELRGNIDTRMQRLATGDYDAIVLAKAGLDRLGWTGRITETLSTELSLPAVGQGALSIEARASDAEVCEVLSQLDHGETRSAIMAERALLAELEGGCQVPLGAWARLNAGGLVLDACVCSPDGVDYVRERLFGSPEDPKKLGRDMAQKLLQAGAGRILRLVGRSVADD